MVEATQRTQAVSPLNLRLRSPRQVSRTSSRVSGGLTINTLRATSGPPAGALSTSSGPLRSDGSRRSTSLFDLPRSGQGFLARLRGSTRSANPLLGGFSFGQQDGVGTSALSSKRVRGGLSLSALQSQQASLRPKFQRLDNSSRLLIARTSASRSNQGFGISLLNRSFNLLG